MKWKSAVRSSGVFMSGWDSFQGRWFLLVLLGQMVCWFWYPAMIANSRFQTTRYPFPTWGPTRPGTT
jgi:hypothetical protein